MMQKRRKCGLLGAKLGHSMSPQIHAKLGGYEYKLHEKLSEEEAKDFILNGDWDALNVTIPWKKLAFSLCSKVSETAAKLKNVNVIARLGNGEIFGDNTDAAGFKKLVEELGLDARGKKCIVLGSGGASKTVQHVLREELGAREVIEVSRSGEEHNYSNLDYDAEVVVNATPVGMFPDIDASPLDLRPFKKCIAVIDLIYNPSPTRLLEQASELGIPCIGGMVMLEEQAKLSSRYMVQEAESER